MNRAPYIPQSLPLRRFRAAVWACALSSMLGAGVLQGAESWQISTRVDSSTGAEISSAMVRNDAGYRLVVEKGSRSGPARCSFKLPDGSEGAGQRGKQSRTGVAGGNGWRRSSMKTFRE